MKKENLVKRVLVKSLGGFTLGVTLLMVAYICVYFIAGESVFQNEICQLQNVKTMIMQIVSIGISYYIIFVTFQIFILLQNKEPEKKYVAKHPYKFVFLIMLLTLLFVLLSDYVLSNTGIFSINIGTLNVVICVLTYVLFGLILVIRGSIESSLVKKINQELKERNS